MEALILLSLLVTIAGGLMLSQATLGVGIIAIGCLLAIYARLAQAERHQKNLLKILHNMQEDTRGEPPSRPS